MSPRGTGGGANVKIEWNDFFGEAEKIRKQVDAVTGKAAHDAETIAKFKVPVDTGELKGNIFVKQISGQRGGRAIEYHLIAATAYAGYVEFGTDHGTHQIPAQPYMTPAVYAVQAGWIAALNYIAKQAGR